MRPLDTTRHGIWAETGIMEIYKAWDPVTCNELLDMIQPVENWEGSEIGFVGKDPIRTSNQFHLSTLSHKTHKQLAAWDKYIFETSAHALKQYSERHIFGLTADEGYTVLRYREGQAYGMHSDDGGTKRPRQISMLLYLNDGFEGGELHFPWQNYTVKPEPGLLVLFPSSFIYRHESKPVKSGIKYAISTFFA